VALARLRVQHLAAGGHLEALLGAGLGLQFGHLALLCGSSSWAEARLAGFVHSACLLSTSPPPRQPCQPGGGRLALWQSRPQNTTKTPDSRLLRPIARHKTRANALMGPERLRVTCESERKDDARPGSPRRQHHHHLAAFEARLLLDL